MDKEITGLVCGMAYQVGELVAIMDRIYKFPVTELIKHDFDIEAMRNARGALKVLAESFYKDF